MQHFPHPVDPVVFGVDLANELDQLAIPDRAFRGGPSFRVTVTTRGQKTSPTFLLQRRTDELDTETITILINKHDHHGRWWPGTEAKKADAAFNNSFVSRSSRTS
ncbi:MAG: hypothetical protein PUK40_04930 [Actinomycetaceae bacterium]|nr:hypothetical protein [Arcanobacterium sp.]MDD7505276.1 hypothetical protein [Actinomycetaceae bacterium]MDY6144039.1 hypothetical protein [Arcanobacterium sp.]